jgi:hypothetical protein
MVLETLPIEQTKAVKLSEDELKKLPNFRADYQSWYSEATACIAQLLPGRLDDFVAYYRPQKTRKEITNASYTIIDYLQGIGVTYGPQKTKIVGPDAAIPIFEQQVNIVKALGRRLESSLFDIRTLVQADLFENELEAAEHLNKRGFQRGAGAIAGVVMEGHLRSVSSLHKLAVPKNATLGKLNDTLKDGSIVDIPVWRFNQHLIDLRNLCDHKLAREPSAEDVQELIAGVRKITKTIF